jgi:hypothetical protein
MQEKLQNGFDAADLRAALSTHALENDISF